MRILVTGADGQLGQALVEVLSNNLDYNVVGLSKQQFDIVKYSNAFLDEKKPELVINAAAYTSVDEAESNLKDAFNINHIGVKNLAISCASKNIPLIHFSTDYVFDGNKDGYWHENDDVNPLNTYGESKLAGEKEIIKHCSKFLIFRTSWVFSDKSNNFVSSILKMAKKKNAIKIVSDQWGNPTCTYEIARIITKILPDINGKWGIYNIAQGPSTNWYEFSKKIINLAKSRNLIKKEINISEINSSQYVTKAKRPKNSKLSTDKLTNVFEINIDSWESSLIKVFDRILKGNV